MKIILTLILALTFLSGCSIMESKEKYCNYAEVIPKAEPIALDPKLLDPCMPLVVPSSPVTYENILRNTKDNTEVYIDCRNRLDAAIVVLKKFGNINP